MAETPEPLAEYARKRDFAHTPEPAGDIAPAPEGAPRFTIQEHSATRLHWDLRLERDGVLVSFALPNALPWAPGENHLAVHTEDHPLEYLTFHGDIPKGNYGAGTMSVWDTGTYEVIKWEDRKIEVHLHGARVDAPYALFPLARKAEEPGKDWMIHLMGEALDPAAEPLPEEGIEPMLARAGKLPPDEDQRWAYEIKWDGVRAVAVSTPGTIRLRSRNGNDITKRYPELNRLNRALSHHRAVLDGEVVAFGPDGRPSFGALQQRMHLASESKVRRIAAESPVTYVVFDLLWLDGHPLVDEPYLQRRALLRDLLADAERWLVPDHVIGHGSKVLDAARAQGLEGVVAKRVDAPYEPGRRAASWVKHKVVARQEVVVGGWLPGEGRRRDRIGSLLVGVPDPDAAGLRYAGRVGTGFTQAELDRLAGILGALEQDASPFLPGGPKVPRGAIWVRPERLAEVEFTEWTADGQLRHPTYKGLRDDKAAEDVVREDEVPLVEVLSETAKARELRVEGRDVRLSNPTKALYPSGFDKTAVLDYYQRVAPVLLGHLAGRALTLKRYPNGTQGTFFYEKNAPSHRPDWVRTVHVGDIDYVLCEDRATLAWLANLADLELHTPQARAEAPLRPTQVVFDLDPGPGTTIVECSRVAQLIRGVLEGIGLTVLPKTSGSKGMQLLLPLNHPDATSDAAKGFARQVAELLEGEVPELVVSRQAKALRSGKVLVDWSQNDDAKTTVCAYSLRAMDEPTVSTPVTWEEVDACVRAEDPALLRFTAPQVLERVAELGDLLAPVLSEVHALPR